MYFPYVFGQSSELLALRSASEQYLSSGAVVPVIEPVKADPSRLARCLQLLGERGQRAVVILNPFQGDFSAGVPAAWFSAIGQMVSEFPSLVPGYLARPGMLYTDAQAFLNFYAQREVAVLHRNNSFTDPEMATIALVPNVLFHIVIQGRITANHLALLPPEKLVHVTDSFNKQQRNADYNGTEHFTDRHRTFATNAVGFGDYTVIGSELQTGGGPPGAVAIHITYRHPANGDLWVEHFVSDEIDRDQGDPGSKFLQAVSKFCAVHPLRGTEFGTNPALGAYIGDHSSSHFPGLAKNKERQILHHIARVHDLLVTGT